SLFLNDGSQHYSDAAAAAGLADDFGSVGGIWGDYDNDGDPDLLIGGEDADNDGDLDLAIGLGDPALFDAISWNADSLRYFFNTRFGDNGLDGVGFLQ